MRHFFTENEEWTKEATEFTREIQQALEPIFERYYLEKDYPMREMQHLGHDAVDELAISWLITKKKVGNK